VATNYGMASNVEPQVKGIDGAGDVAVVFEITPKPGTSWWYAKRKLWCGLQTQAFVRSEEYDDKGQKQRNFFRRVRTGLDAKGGQEWYVYWGALFVQDLKSGFRGDMWASEMDFNPGFPTTIFSTENLLREPRQLGWWK
jgi:hypothetical protein